MDFRLVYNLFLAQGPHLVAQKSSTNSNTVKHFYNLK